MCKVGLAIGIINLLAGAQLAICMPWPLKWTGTVNAMIGLGVLYVARRKNNG